MSFYGIDHPNPNTPQGVYPRRGGATLSGTCIIHTSESVLDVIGDDSTAEDCAAFIVRRSDYGSYHNLVDSDSIIEIFPFEWETWQDSETNNWAVGISAACRTTDWATMGDAKREGFYRNLAWCAADFIKYMATKGIEVPLKRISGAEARARKPGFCAHGDSGISRSDPGRDFDWNRFFKYTAEALNGVIEEEDQKMLVIATEPNENGKIWIGDGITRRHIPSPFILDTYKKMATWGMLKIYKGGDPVTLPVEALGQIVGADAPFTNLYGVPVTLGIQLAHIDRNVNDARDLLFNAIGGVKADVELTPEAIISIADSLKNSLAPGVAAELAKRLSE